MKAGCAQLSDVACCSDAFFRKQPTDVIIRLNMVPTGQAGVYNNGSTLRDGAGEPSTAEKAGSDSELTPRNEVACSAEKSPQHCASADESLDNPVARNSCEKALLVESKPDLLHIEERGNQKKIVTDGDEQSAANGCRERRDESLGNLEAESVTVGDLRAESNLLHFGNVENHGETILEAERNPTVESNIVDVSNSEKHDGRKPPSDSTSKDPRNFEADDVVGLRKHVEVAAGADIEKGRDEVIFSVAEELEKAKSRALSALYGDADLASLQKSMQTSKSEPPDGRDPPKRRRSRRKKALRRKDGRKAMNGIPVPGTAAQPEGGTEDVIFEYIPSAISIPDGYSQFSDIIANFIARSDTISDEIGNDDANFGFKAHDIAHTGATTGEVISENRSQPISKLASRGTGRGGDRTPVREVEKDATGNESPPASPGLNQSRPRAANRDDLSERRHRRQQRLTVAELKALVPRPELVEPWDVTAADPLLLVYLKYVTGSVVVPSNWRQKSKYLQSKRGMEKLPFKLPAYIEETGVGASRAAADEVEASKTAKQKGRERIRPKTGKGVDVDYSVMRDAFFKFQSKPRLTAHGDLYYELREREVNHERFRPGVLSAELREALGIGEHEPSPWLVAMQRYGPPPSYPNLVIPGLNAPIPPGASFGYHPGGWGKPPIDEFGRPLYGDVFGEGVRYNKPDTRFDMAEEEQSRLWGEPEANAEDDAEEILAPSSTGSMRDGEKAGVDATEATGSADASGVSGVLSITGALATPSGGIQLRKGPAPGKLFDVLEERVASVGSTGIIGSSHVYVVPSNECVSDSAERGVADGAGLTDGADAEMLLSKKRKVQEDAPPEAAAEGKKEKKFKF
jgi:splicing factor 3B subunit 2